MLTTALEDLRVLSFPQPPLSSNKRRSCVYVNHPSGSQTKCLRTAAEILCDEVHSARMRRVQSDKMQLSWVALDLGRF